MKRLETRVTRAHLEHNFKCIKAAFPNQRIMTMVKNNSYGHGLLQTARAVQAADFFGVSDVREAYFLRDQGFQTPIVVMGGLWSVDDFFACLERDIFLVVYDAQVLDAICMSSLRPKRLSSLWVKVDTGMNRLGLSMDEATERLPGLDRDAAIESVTVMTHFANADQANLDRMQLQIEKARELKCFVRGLSSKMLVSFANSATCMNYPEFLGDIIRPGLMLYGVFPNLATRLARKESWDLKPAISVQSRIVMLKTVPVGGAVGYASRWEAKRDTQLAVISIGYGDGYYRYAQDGTPVFIRGQQVPLVGRVSMDMITVDVTDLADVCVGDEVLLWGEELPVEEIEAFNDASSYDLLTTIGNRGNVVVV